MRSPFPGMDPWLEAHWRDVHTRLVMYSCDTLQQQLPEDLVARVEEGVSVDGGADPRVVSPDVRVVETPREGLWPLAPSASAAAVAEPILLQVDEPETERHIEILDRTTGNRVVTAIEVLSPTNKDRFEGRPRYWQKQAEYLAAGVNLVEIDLLRGGDFAMAFPLKKLSWRRRTPYYVCVRRAARPKVAEIVRIPLRNVLPTISIPLRSADGDITLNLQQLIDDCYFKGRYSATIDYSEPPDPPFDIDDERWADELLRAAGRRG